MGTSVAHCQGNVREFQSVWRVVTLKTTDSFCYVKYLNLYLFRCTLIGVGSQATFLDYIVSGIEMS